MTSFTDPAVQARIAAFLVDHGYAEPERGYGHATGENIAEALGPLLDDIAAEAPDTAATASRTSVDGISPGDQVRLTVRSSYLADAHGATVGTVGTVLAPSRVNPDDHGWLIDFGDGQPVRCSPHELARA